MVRAEEDRINKPFRPVPMGLITEHGAVVRSRVWSAVLVVAGLALNITPYAVLWIASINWYNFGSGSKHWFVKNQVFLVLSCLAGFAPIWLIAQNVWTQTAIAWTVAVCVYEALAVTVQVRPCYPSELTHVHMHVILSAQYRSSCSHSHEGQQDTSSLLLLYRTNFPPVLTATWCCRTSEMWRGICCKAGKPYRSCTAIKAVCLWGVF